MSSSTTLIVASLLLLLLFTLSNAAQFNVVNKCSYTVWAAAVPGGGQQLNPGQSWTVTANPGTTGGRVWARTGCNFDANGNGHCQTGDCGGLLQCQAYGTPPNTLAEYAQHSGGAKGGLEWGADADEKDRLKSTKTLTKVKEERERKRDNHERETRERVEWEEGGRRAMQRDVVSSGRLGIREGRGMLDITHHFQLHVPRRLFYNNKMYWINLKNNINKL